MKVFIAAICGFVLICTASAQQHNIEPAMKDANWQVSASHLRCQMSQLLPLFGRAYFVQKNAQPPFFTITSWQGVGTGIVGKVYSASPTWKPRGDRSLITQVPFKSGKYPVHMNAKHTKVLLSALISGQQIYFDYRSDLDDRVSLNLSPINFQQAYDKYIKCIDHLLPFAYHDVRETILYFSNEGFKLSDHDKRRLNRIRKYVLADPKIKQVFIAGYSDSEGRSSLNNYYSQQRAEMVKKYLLSRGVPADKIKTTWFGEKRPIGDNTTERGRAENRRVVIQLEKI